MRLRGAQRGIALAFLGLGLAALLDARGLRKTAEIQRHGLVRDASVAVTRGLVDVSGALYLDRPRRRLQVAIGREHDDQIDTRISFRLPPPAGPLPVPASHPRGAHPRAPHRQHRAHRQPLPVFTAAHPLRVWVAGDSLAQVPGEALERLAAHVRPLDVLGVESRVSTGLGQPALYNWFTRIAQAIPELHPNVAVLSFGADDEHDYLGGVPAGRKIGKLGSPSWKAEYLRRVDGVTRELNAAHVYVVWLGLPVPGSDGYMKGFRVVNDVLRRAALRHRQRAAYIDTWHLLDNGHSGYTPYVRGAHGRLILARAADGIHYTAAGGDFVSQAILARLRTVYRLRVR
jgi:hypothetical protein